jgi:hypothetical protein
MAGPAKFLLIIAAGGETLARLFDAQRTHITDFDASSEEVAVMTSGLVGRLGVESREWGRALEGHNADELRTARVFTLDV